MITVESEQLDPEYKCDCPHCGETQYSVYNDSWDEHEMLHCDIKIICDDCKEEFYVSFPTSD